VSEKNARKSTQRSGAQNGGRRKKEKETIRKKAGAGSALHAKSVSGRAKLTLQTHYFPKSK